VIPGRALTGQRWQRLAGIEQTACVRIARDELQRVRNLTRIIDGIEHKLA